MSDMTTTGQVGEMTKGPWQQHDNAAPYGESYAATVWGPNGPGFGLVADCRCGNRGEMTANAKAIATVPDLIEALGVALHALRHPVDGWKDEVENKAIGVVAAALKKVGCL